MNDKSFGQLLDEYVQAAHRVRAMAQVGVTTLTRAEREKRLIAEITARTAVEQYATVVPPRPPEVLYVECHVVVRIAPLHVAHPANDFGRPEDSAIIVGEQLGFWHSVLTVDESKEEQKGDLIFTCRAATREEGLAKMRGFRDLSATYADIYTVERYKVEEITFDTKKGSTL